MLAELWADDRLRRGQISARSAELYLNRLGSLLGMYETVDELDRAAIIAWQRSLTHLRQSSRHAYIGAVGRFLRWLHTEGHTSTDLSMHLGQVRVPRGVPRALQAGEVARVLAGCHRQRDRLIVHLMLDCGLRCLEVSRLNVEDYDPAAATIFVRGKGGHERVLPVPTATQQSIDLYLAERGYHAGPLVIGVGNKTPVDGRLSEKAISKRLGAIMAASGVHRPGDGKSAHALRHTAASDVLDRCLDLRVVQQMLGHASLSTTERYLRRADLGRLRAAMEGRSYDDIPRPERVR